MTRFASMITMITVLVAAAYPAIYAYASLA